MRRFELSDGTARQAWQFVHPNGEVAINGPFDMAHGFRDGAANVRISGKWGLIDREGRFLVTPRYDMVWPSHKQRSAFQQDAKWGYLDPTGQVALEPRFDEVTNFDNPSSPVALFSMSDKWGVIRTDGSVVVPAEWDGVAVGKDGWIRVVRKGLSGFVDPSGKLVIDVKFRCDSFAGDRALVNVDGKFGFIDKRGELVIEPVYENGEAFSDGLAFVKQGGKYGAIDTSGRVVIPFQYDGCVGFADGRAFVWPDSKAVCIDKTGKKVSATRFGDANTFEQGLAVVGKTANGPFGLVDTDCKLAVPMEYAGIDGVVGTHRKICKKTLNGVRHGYLDVTGKVVCEAQFIDAQPLPEDLAAVQTMIALPSPSPSPLPAPTPSLGPVATASRLVPHLLLSAQQIRDHANMRSRPALADHVIAVAEDRAAIRKLLRADKDHTELAACPYFWLETLGSKAVVALEVAIEVLRAEMSKLAPWAYPANLRDAMADCTTALQAIDTWEATCAHARLFGCVDDAKRDLSRALHALAVVGLGDAARQSFAELAAEHPGSAKALLETKLPPEDVAAIRVVMTTYAVGLPEASEAEIPLTPLPPVKKATKLPEFWNPRLFARPLLVGRQKALPLKALDQIAARFERELGVEERREFIKVLKAGCDPQSLRDFGWSVFSTWLAKRSPPKQKWALTMLGHFGDDDTVAKLAPMIAEWPGQSQHARAVLGLSVLGGIGTDSALRAIYRLSQRAKFGGLKSEAQQTIAHIAKQRGLTQEELADRLVPDFDLDHDGSMMLDFGARTFRVGFDEGLHPYVINQDEKRSDDLPKPNQHDDAARSADALATWKNLKKEVRAIASLHIGRLEKAMCERRRWHEDAFRMYFVEHPLLQHLARRLVWGVYDTAKLTATFRVAQDRTFADVRDSAVEIPDGALVGIVHPLDLERDAIAAWSQVLADYELMQPFEQLGRVVYAITEKERTTRKLERLVGQKVPAGSLIGLLSRGWSRGSVEDNGVVYELHHPLATLKVAPGIYFGPGAIQDDQEVREISLGKVDDPIAFSELCHSLESLRKPSS